MVFKKNSPIILTIILYLLFFLLRIEQGGWEISPNLFLNQRQVFSKRIVESMPSPQGQLLSGILLGDKNELPPKLRLSLRDTSTLHIVVVSGQNLSILAGFFLALSAFITRKLSILFSFIFILFYVLLTGAEIPVIRAAFMSTLSYLAVILGRQRDGLWVLVVTAGILLLINPHWIFDLSFQLSFLATMGMIIVAPVLLNLLKGWPKFISQDLSLTTGAQIMVIPIIAQYFHQISYVGIIANLLVGWVIPIVMILGGILLAVSFISETLAGVIAIVLNGLLTYFIYVVEFFASSDFAWGYVGEQSFLVWAGYYLIIFGILLAFSKNKARVKK